MKKDLNLIFNDLVSRYVKNIEKNYQSRYKRAKDKEFVKEEIITDTDFVLGWALLHPENKEIIDVFSARYKRGEDIKDILTHIRRTYGEIDDVKPYRRIEKTADSHRSNMMKKLRACNTAQLLKAALEGNLLETGSGLRRPGRGGQR